MYYSLPLRFTRKIGRLWPAVPVLCLLLLFLPVSVRAEGASIEEVADRLEEAAALVDQGDFEAAGTVLEGLQVVQLEDGSEMKLAAQAWRALLDTRSPDLADHLRELAVRLRAPGHLPANSRQRLEEVLANHESQAAGTSPAEAFLSWLREWLQPVFDWFEPLFDGVPWSEGSVVMQLLLWLATFASILVVLGVVGIFFRGLRQNLLEQEEITGLDQDDPIYAFEAQQQASEVAQAGDLREAMRLLYLAALLHLDEVGLIRFDRSQTNREVLAAVPGRGGLRELLAPVVEQFDRVWYGHAAFSQSDFEQMRRQIEQLRAMEPES